MPLTEEHDRLIDILLEELVGGQTPPDLTSRVIKRAMAAPRRRWRTWPALAAAAAVLAAIGLWAVLAHSYPAPAATGDFRIVEGGKLTRGSALATEAGHATLTLGGYVRADIDPHSQVRVQGAKRAESVDLQTGSASFDVDRNIGAFMVRTDVGTVSVTGTRFTVRMLENQGDTMSPRRMVVKVLVGSVMVSGAWGSTTLLAGQERTLGPAALAATTQRTTLTGVGKAIGDPNAKTDPAIANATLTVTADDGTQTVYDVYGWGGIIIAKNANGKRVEVTGFIGEKDGRKTITAASVGVKIIVVN